MVCQVALTDGRIILPQSKTMGHVLLRKCFQNHFESAGKTHGSGKEADKNLEYYVSAPLKYPLFIMHLDKADS